MTVRIRGIYTTALTELFRDEPGVVQPSPPIVDRFDAEFTHEPATVTVETTADRQGVRVTGDPDAVEAVSERLADVGRDALVWSDPTPRGAVYDGAVTETLGGGAIVALGDGEGYLPYGETDRRIEDGDRIRVQVDEPSPPWSGDRATLSTTIRAHGSLVTLVRGETIEHTGPELADILPADPVDGWGSSWHRHSDDAGLDALGDALERANDRAAALDDALADAPAPADDAPQRHAAPESTAWVWFGRESRFALDDARDAVTATMPGHHRIKAGSRSASAGVDLAEAVADGFRTGEQDFPFTAVASQFGPAAGDTVRLDHGKPDGRLYTLGDAAVQSVEPDGTVTVEREMSPGGTYDALGVDRQAGDVATTKVKEGRWWYPTVYEGADGTKRGTYVNVCTPVEVFPDAVRYVDLHVDVVKHADGRVERVDDDELDAAVEGGHVSAALAEKARSVAKAVKHGLE
ncbi:DUF402 domain-containing protein [Halomicrobium sp. IBSBa]|uniref:DUF402 domain-containing protein n=1 Tax=Halomicrobium sp. IBSBa TaxID=2778916 RepID=UPI001ABF0F5A|nr:DUF402 domain-containing protein [Halomicrobium sp. IBSBa]MBO4247303.1 DUF402 domain-containing protein [Halomicrobium sp. IBSBa]